MNAIDYTKQFLLRNNYELIGRVGYTSNPEEFNKYDVVILRSSFFDDDVYGTDSTMPLLPLSEWEGIPILFKGNEPSHYTGVRKDVVIIKADIIASSYFLISRYEETINHDNRDKFGRFIGKGSLPYKAGFIDRPIVDEYSKKLLEILGTSLNTETFKMILTHDIDQIYKYRRLRPVLGSIRFGLFEFIKAMFCFLRLKKDPYDTVRRLISNDFVKLRKNYGDIIFFIKVDKGKNPIDRPKNKKKDLKKLFETLDKYNVKIGLHNSFHSCLSIDKIKDEMARFYKLSGVTPSKIRYHYLASINPHDMAKLENIGITDDYTVGYADIVGFRLGTCRPVKYINIEDKTTHKLLLHPLITMDTTLRSEQYMNLSALEATEVTKKLINTVRTYGGEMVTLTHNSKHW